MRLPAFPAWAVLAICRVAFAQTPADNFVDPRAGRTASAKARLNEAVLINEQIAPGTEQHSPSTLGLSIQDPRTARQSPGATGSVGTLHVLSADLGRSGVLRFSALGEYFHTNNFPVMTASDTRSAGTFALSYVPLDFLELYANYSASANTNSTSSPHLISSLGDFGAGAKAATRLGHALYAGIDARVISYAGVGNPNLRGSALGFAPALLATYDMHRAIPGLPLRLHGNFGALIDNTRTAVASQTLNAAEQYALSVNRYQRLTLGLAAEVPLPVVTPFVEYNLRFPLRVPGGVLVGPDGVVVPIGRVLPQAISAGAKITAISNLTLIAAVDFGLSRLVGLGLPASPPYNILFGAAFNVDPFSRGETRIVEKVTPAPRREVPRTGKVSGVVVDAETKKPISAAIVAMIGAGVPPVASDDESGAFVSHELPAGPVKLAVQKEGYRPWERDLMLQAGRTSRIEIDLVALAKKARFAISVTSKSQPIAASVVFKGPEERQVPFSGASAEAVKVETVPGKYVINVTAPRHLAQTREVQVAEGSEMALNFDLLPKPKRVLVTVRENKIDTLRKIHFAPGRATILADSFPLLAQLVDAIVKGGIKRIRVEGHTDNRGNRRTNLELSSQRARAVAYFLEQAGIDRERLEAVGFGDSRPIAPNLTARGRELNRRVELIIVDQ